MTAGKNLKIAFIIWNEFNRRPAELSKILHCKPLFIKRIINNRSKAWKYLFWIDYLYKSIYTLIYLISNRPEYVIAQSPPSFCPIVCYIYCKVRHKSLIIDGHNGGFERPWIKIPFYQYVMRKSNFILVHNIEFQNFLQQKFDWNNLFLLPDPIPNVIRKQKMNENQKYFFVILSFAADEPLEELFAAMRLFLLEEDYDVNFIISGNYNRKFDIYSEYSKLDGINFVGYVDNLKYEELLVNAFGVIALSKRQMVQQCAAVESLGAEVPVILSENITNNRIFFKGAELTTLSTKNIRTAIINFISKQDRLKSEIKEVKIFWENDWLNQYKLFLKKSGL